MKDAFSFTNRPRLGQAKGGLGFKGAVDRLKCKQVHKVAFDLCTCFLVYVFPYDNGHVGWTSISSVEVCPRAYL
jgi:hypothetical protein